ncbi:hypothetical protein K449DRAFT_381076 [Hypoxylon sp. EC38]|nr:hypothetical protein K449DRAFT_381076 [Hypoxylon sp. EC38]
MDGVDIPIGAYYRSHMTQGIQKSHSNDYFLGSISCTGYGSLDYTVVFFLVQQASPQMPRDTKRRSLYTS